MERERVERTGCVPAAVAGVSLARKGQQCLDDAVVAGGTRQMQRCVSPEVGGVDVGVAVAQHVHDSVGPAGGYQRTVEQWNSGTVKQGGGWNGVEGVSVLSSMLSML